MNIKINVKIKVSRIIKYFVLSDLFLLAGWGFIEPIFSVFIIEKIVGATLLTVGVAAAIYWILKSLLEIPIANILDKIPGEKDDFLALISGLLLASFSAFAFTWINQIWELYVVQIIHAIAFAFYLPSWSAIFSRHLDRERVSFDWSLDSTATGISAGITGFLSGLIAEKFGFSTIFIWAGFLSLISALILIFFSKITMPKPTHSEEIFKNQTPVEKGL
jgi:DHA1 family quinolone resistance protein-like MFS transporter